MKSMKPCDSDPVQVVQRRVSHSGSPCILMRGSQAVGVEGVAWALESPHMELEQLRYFQEDH